MPGFRERLKKAASLTELYTIFRESNTVQLSPKAKRRCKAVFEKQANKLTERLEVPEKS